MALSKYAEKGRARRARKQRRRAAPLLASAILVSVACAKQLETPADDDTVATTGGTGARGGTSGAKGGTGGSGGSGLVGTGGSVGATGGSAALGGSGGAGTSGTSGSGTTAGTATSGGRSASGGTNATAGHSASGGTNATGGMPNNGGMPATSGTTSAGGVANTGGHSGSGTGAAGMPPNDPNWKPPDMSAAKFVVLYQATQTATSARDVRMTLTLKNMSDAPYDMSNVTIKYFMTAEPAPQTHLDYGSSNLMANTPTFVTSDGSYLKFTFKKGGSLPVYVDQNSANAGQLQGRVDTMIANTNFNQANDFSYDATATAAKINAKIAVYDGTTLIFGCDPWHNCADTSSTGAGGAGGQSGI